jgi:negative regulator of sigma E activity
VLNALDGDAEVARQWRRYNVISAAMRNELGHFAQVDLSARVRESLAQEAPPLPLERPARGRAWYRPAASVAVAASVTAAILTGTQLYTAAGGQRVEPSVALAANVPTGPVGPVAAIGQTAGFGDVPTVVAPAGGADMEGAYRLADEMARLRLEAYLQSHIDQASLNTSIGMMPFARVSAAEAAR